MISRITALLGCLLLFGCVAAVNDQVLAGKERVTSWNSKLVIAHRGASGYLPEHTIAAKAMAYAQGADYIEQDLVMTKDDEVVVLHDQRRISESCATGRALLRD
jgi:glycerophosphoryl diester phosphodiesterase